MDRVPTLKPFVSVIVPVWREAALLRALLDSLAPVQDPRFETVVVCAHGGGAAPPELRRAHRAVVWTDAPAGRGTQMNWGASLARGAWLWFLHVDSRLPPAWTQVFDQAERAGAVWGHFAFALDSTARQARWLEQLVACRSRWLRLPYGDQGIFVRRDVFWESGGYPPWPLMEDIDLARRLGRRGKPMRLEVPLVTSARRWEQDGWWRRSVRNNVLLGGYFVGIAPHRLARWYTGRGGG